MGQTVGWCSSVSLAFIVDIFTRFGRIFVLYKVQLDNKNQCITCFVLSTLFDWIATRDYQGKRMNLHI